jgi:hypothetical protein
MIPIDKRKIYKVTWKEVVTYEEVIVAESEEHARVYAGAEPEKVHEDVVESSLKVERID